MDSIIIENIEEYTGKLNRKTIFKLENEKGVEGVICGAPTIDLKFTDEKLASLILAERFGHIFPHMRKKKSVFSILAEKFVYILNI